VSTRPRLQRPFLTIYISVTGGGTGLGLVTATALAQNNCRVYITGRRGDVLEQAAKDATPPAETGGEVIAIQADVSGKEGIDSKSTGCCRSSFRRD
jgi:NAD(P)-dependent dehydrogenase (short-subunit alcohol dehydrogenase family)